MSSDLTVARPYAKAVFELARNDKDFAKWSDMLQTASLITKDPTIRTLMKDPKFSTEKTLALFLDLGKDIFSEEMKHFLQILAKFKRIGILPRIADLFEELRAEAERTVTVEITTAKPIREEDKQRFERALRIRLDRDITIESFVDKNLLGGAIIRAGDLYIDGSIRGRLAKLSDAVGISF